jgi:hypothetical protein
MRFTVTARPIQLVKCCSLQQCESSCYLPVMRSSLALSARSLCKAQDPSYSRSKGSLLYKLCRGKSRSNPQLTLHPSSQTAKCNRRWEVRVGCSWTTELGISQALAGTEMRSRNSTRGSGRTDHRHGRRPAVNFISSHHSFTKEALEISVEIPVH